MQLLLSIAITLLLSLKGLLAANDLRVILNYGLPPSTGNSCTATEMAKVSALFTKSRNLRDGDISNSMKKSRQLTTTRYCSNACSTYPANRCFTIGCRRALSEGSEKEGNRKLLTCTQEINDMHTKLDNVRNTVSTSCKSFLEQKKRTIECFADVEHGLIEGIRVWDASGVGQNVFKEFVAPGGTVTICKNLKLSIESMNQPCVEDVSYMLTGPNNYNYTRNEWNPPYTLFGDDGIEYFGQNLPTIGTYNLVLIPDYNITKKKEFKVVVNC